MHPFDQILDPSSTNDFESTDSSVSRRTALGAALAAGLGAAAAAGELHAQQATTRAVGEEGGKVCPTTERVGEEGGDIARPVTKAIPEEGGPQPPVGRNHDGPLYSGDIEVSYKFLVKLLGRQANAPLTIEFRKGLEIIARYETERCAQQLKNDRFGKLEPLVTLMKISKMTKLPAPMAMAKAKLKRHANLPEFKKALALTGGGHKPDAQSEPPRATTLAVGEEGGGIRR